MAAFSAAAASDFLPAAMSLRTSLTADLNLSLTLRLWDLRRSDCLIALAADLVLGIKFDDFPPEGIRDRNVQLDFRLSKLVSFGGKRFKNIKTNSILRHSRR